MAFAPAVWLAIQEDLSTPDDVPRSFLDQFDDNFLFRTFHLTRPCLVFVTDLLKARLNDFVACGCDTPSQDAGTVLAALYYYAHGVLSSDIVNLLGLEPTSAVDAVDIVSKELASMIEKFITFPSSHNDRMGVAQEFKNFSDIPNVVGVVGCLHVKVTPPSDDSAHLYLNSLGFHSVMTQIVCDADGNLLGVEQCLPGGTPEQHVWESSNVNMQFNSFLHGQTWVAGGKGHLMSRCMLTTLDSSNVKTIADKRFNAAHVQIRDCILQTFGSLKNRFRCLEDFGPVNTSNLDRVAQVIGVCCVLHNIAKKFSVPLPQELTQEPEHPVAAAHGRDSMQAEGEAMREELIRACFT